MESRLLMVENKGQSFIRAKDKNLPCFVQLIKGRPRLFFFFSGIIMLDSENLQEFLELL